MEENLYMLTKKQNHWELELYHETNDIALINIHVYVLG